MIDKKFRLRNIVAMAAIFLAASCDKTEENGLDYKGSPNSVTFSIEIPTEYQVSRSSFPSIPTDHQLRCIIEVWDSSLSNRIAREEIIASSESDAKANIELEDATYNYVIWSDYIYSSATKTDGHYTDLYYTTNNATEGLKGITITSQRGSDPATREAFYQKATEFTMASQSLSLSATLTRAISMLTIAEINTDYLTYCSQVSTTYETPSEFNASNGTTSGSTLSVSSQGVVGDKLSLDGTICQSLFVDYILADISGSDTLGEISMSLSSSSSTQSFPNITIPAGIPIKQNYQIYATGEIVSVTTHDDDGSQDSQNSQGDTSSGDSSGSSTDGDKSLTISLSFICDWSASLIHTIINANDIIEISSPDDMIALATDVSNSDLKSGVYYKLTTDLDFTGVDFTPIGTTSTKCFKGSFDGDGHKITGLSLNSSLQYCGLFGTIGDGATISNLTISGSISSTRTSSTYIGGLMGKSASGSKIINCHSEMDITVASSGNIGGISGYNEGAIIVGSSFSGSINSSNSNSSALYCGGITGLNYNSIINCQSSGEISVTINDSESTTDNCYIGGLAGYSNGVCTNSFNNGPITVSGTIDRNLNIGGILGSTASSSSTSNCYNIGSINSSTTGSTSYIGYAIGYNDSAVSSIGNVYSHNGSNGAGDYSIGESIDGELATATADFAAALNTGAQSYNSSYPTYEAYGWSQNESENNGYPTLTTTSAGVN